jgi:hypothetical protein
MEEEAMMQQEQITQLARELIPYVVPFVPYLIETGKEAGKELAKAIGKKLGEDIPDITKSILKKLWPTLLETPSAREAAIDAAARKEDKRTLAALEWQLEKLLANDKQFRREIAALLLEAERSGTKIKTDLEIEELGGELRIVHVQDAATMRESGTSLIETEAKIRRTQRGSKTTVVDFESGTDQ